LLEEIDASRLRRPDPPFEVKLPSFRLTLTMSPILKFNPKGSIRRKSVSF
jgi:hypothetical protein